MKKRICLYCVGIVIMSLGLSLNVKSYMGVAPILTIPRVVSEIFQWEFSNVLFMFYGLFILLQFFLKQKLFRPFDLIQFPIGLGITRLVAIFTLLIPTSETTILPYKCIILVLAIVTTGIGVALTVDMKIAPNPADGLAAAVGERFGIELGMGKNIVDISSVIIAFIISMLHSRNLGPIGIGTVAAGLLVGRVIAIFNKKYRRKLEAAVGIKN